MMRQNRQTVKDRLRAELAVAAVHAHRDELYGRQWATLLEVQQKQLALLSRIAALPREDYRATTW